MKATEIIRYFEGTTTDATEIVTSASFLESLGWDFSDYNRTEDDEVIILVQGDDDKFQTNYHIRPSNSTYTVDGYNPTGDDNQTLIDIASNLKEFIRI